MPTNFPDSLDEFNNPTATDTVEDVNHADQHADANDAIEALQFKMGADGSDNEDSHDFKLSEVAAGDKAAPKSTTDAHIENTENPHNVNKAQVGLASVTNDAQLKRSAGDINSFALKNAPVDDDVVLIEDSEDGFTKKRVKKSSLGGAVADKAIVRAYKSDSNLTLTTAFAKVTFGTEVFDVGENFASSTFTAPRAGKYLLSAICGGASIDSSSRVSTIAIYKNGVLASQAHASKIQQSSSLGGIAITDLLDLAEGDTVEIYAKCNAAGAQRVDTGTENTFLSVIEV